MYENENARENQPQDSRTAYFDYTGYPAGQGGADNMRTSAGNMGTFADNMGTSAGSMGTSADGVGTSAGSMGTFAGNMRMAAEPPRKAGKKEKTGRKAGGVRKVMLSAGLGLCFGLFAGAGFYGVKLGADRLSPPEVQDTVAEIPPQITANPNLQLSQNDHVVWISADYSDVVEEVMPAMVSIVNNYTRKGTSIWGQTYEQPGRGSGSGIIVARTDRELLLVSNNHVVEGTNELEVTFIDGSTATASIKGLDPDMDLAVIAVDLESLTEETRAAIAVAKLGDSDSLKLGEPVIAIGNALGYGQSVTDGIVSALNREVTMEDGSTGLFIQTNAAINPGNSGGALLNINGEVIGINSNKIGGEAVEGMGYAIPISAASPIITNLMEYQSRNKVPESDKGYMGITMQKISEQSSLMYNMPQGVFVYEVQKGSAAEKAGIVKGDIIVKLDGFAITALADIENAMQYYAAGDTAVITVKRFVNGEYESSDLEITFGSRPAGN